MNSISQRVNAVPELSKMLPAGTEGGKEFSRIVGLLLFNEARRENLTFSLFDDAAGDFEGLDGFSKNAKTKAVVGYQYKFFPSPLSDSHRAEIKNSLEKAIERNEKLKLIKWVLVTPDDFKNPSNRKSKGDVTWFEELKIEYQEKIEIDHIGHSKLQDFFLKTPHLCLYYYPEHLPRGKARRKTIHELRNQYNLNMKQRYGKIEFVGMSVYKEEASRRISLEDIYIPLSVVGERQSVENDQTPRINPINFLNRGSKTVILGDPGSGKSTLFNFLALAGINEKLQARCDILADDRLTIILTLRRYADGLKSNVQLSILDHVRQVAAADFNLTGLDSEFYEFYLESGQAIIFFDGLDELPNTKLKETVRRRIESFTSSFPGNTVLISSRLVGYDAELRFDKSYNHYRIAKLRIPEINKFIKDWYSVRVEETAERDRNANDLIKVITSVESEAIRELARNPLLLTIVALVHRIDAVLPDQRVVLYQKCTETLLNTWYKAKRQDDEIAKARIEQRNRTRIEAVAYWLHTKSIGNEGRSIAAHQDLLDFLTDHIQKNENFRESDGHPQDHAEEFLSFIKNSAGLLIEAGDNLYSFIHLTFQEYLSATYLLAFGETKGAQSIWDELHGDLHNPRWREVVRLMVASLRSISGKSFFIEKLLEVANVDSYKDTSLLLTGLIKDSIESAELKAVEIFELTLKSLTTCSDLEEIVSLRQSLESLIQKDKKYDVQIEEAWNNIYAICNIKEKINLILIRKPLGMDVDKRFLNTELMSLLTPNKKTILEALIFDSKNTSLREKNIRDFSEIQKSHANFSITANATSVVCLGASMLLNPANKFEQLFNQEFSLFFSRISGPYNHHGLNLLTMARACKKLHPALEKAYKFSLKQADEEPATKAVDVMESIVEKWMSKHFGSSVGTEYFYAAFGSWTISKISGKNSFRYQFRKTEKIFNGMKNELSMDFFDISKYWNTLKNSEIFSRLLTSSLESALKENLDFHWSESIGYSAKISIPEVFSQCLDSENWKSIAERISTQNLSNEEINFVAWLILYDIWILTMKGYRKGNASPLDIVLKAAQTSNAPKVIFSLALRKCALREEGSLEHMCTIIDENADIKNLLHNVGWPEHEKIISISETNSKQIEKK